MRSIQKLVAFLTVFTAGCTILNQVSVTDPGSGFRATPRPADCRIEFFRTKAPEHAYDELGTLHWQGSGGFDARHAQEELRSAACNLGADAAIVTRDHVPGGMDTPAFMTVTALKYRAVPGAAKAPAATPGL